MNPWQPPVPRRSNALPLILAAVSLVGALAIFSIGVMIGFRAVSRSLADSRATDQELTEISEKQLPPDFTAKPIGADGWVMAQFNDMHLSIALPAEPTPAKLTRRDADPDRYANVREFSIYDSYGKDLDATMSLYRYFRHVKGGSRSVVEEMIRWYKDQAEYSKVKPSGIRDTIIAGKHCLEADVTYEWSGQRYRMSTFMTDDEKSSLQLLLTGPEKSVDAGYRRLKRSVEFLDKS